MSSTTSTDWKKFLTGEIHKDSSREISIATSYGKSSGKLWGPLDGQAIIALHGWQDCCTTFDCLIPLLPNNYLVIAMDLPGHGHSQHHGPKNMYNIVSYMLWLKEVADILRLDRFILLAHSMSVGTLTPFVTILQPHRVRKFITLDIVHPVQMRDIVTTPNFLDLMDNYEKQASADPKPLDRAVAVRKIIDQRVDLDETTVEYLMPRITKDTPDGRVTFTRDPRLTMLFFMEFMFQSFEDYERMYQKFTGEWLMIKATQSAYIHLLEKDKEDRVKKALGENAEKFELFETPGGHYVHLTHPERIANKIGAFLDSGLTTSRL